MKTVDFDKEIKNIKDRLAEVVPASKVTAPNYEVEHLKLRQQLQLIANELLAVKIGQGKTTTRAYYDITTGPIMASLRSFRSNPTKESQKSFLVVVRQDLGEKTAKVFEEWLQGIFKEKTNG